MDTVAKEEAGAACAPASRATHAGRTPADGTACKNSGHAGAGVANAAGGGGSAAGADARGNAAGASAPLSAVAVTAAQAAAPSAADARALSGAASAVPPAALSGAASAAPPAALSGAASAAPDPAGGTLVRPKEAVSDPLLVREYCCQAIDDTLNAAVSALLDTLLRFQDKLHAADPIKARAKRRLVCGLRETVRSLRTGKARCVIIAHNIEQIDAEGALDDMVLEILKLSRLKYNPMIEKHPDIQLEVRAAPSGRAAPRPRAAPRRTRRAPFGRGRVARAPFSPRRSRLRPRAFRRSETSQSLSSLHTHAAPSQRRYTGR